MKEKSTETMDENNKEVGSIKKRKNKKISIIILGIVIVELILIFALTPYRMLLIPNKMELLSYTTKDVLMLKDVIKNTEESKILNFISNERTKSANFDFDFNAKKISGEGIFDSEYFALKLNDITDNYLLLENKKINEFLAKFWGDSDGIPSKIDFKNNPIALTNSEKNKIYSFIIDAITNMLDNLEKEKIISKEEIVFNVNDEDMILNSIEVQFSESDIFMAQKELLMSLQDEGVLNMLLNKMNQISTTETIDKKEIKSEIEKYIAYLDYAKSYCDLQESDNEYYIIYKIYHDGKNVVAREIIEKYTYEGTLYEDVICRLVTTPDGYYEVKWFSQDDYKAYYNIISDKITTSNNKQNHEIKYKVEGFFVGDVEGEEEYQYIPLKGEALYNFIVETFDNGETKVELIDSSDTNKFMLNYTDNKVGLEVTTKYNELDVNVKLQVKEIETTKEELVNNGAMLINDKTTEELIAEFTKIGNEFSEIFADSEKNQ